MINQLTAAEVVAECQRILRADTQKGTKRAFDRFMTRMLGVSSTPTPGIEFVFEVNAGEGLKRSQFDKIVKRMGSYLDYHIEAGYYPDLATVSLKKSPKYGTYTYTFALKRELVTSAHIRNFLAQLCELAEPFAYMDDDLAHGAYGKEAA